MYRPGLLSLLHGYDELPRYALDTLISIWQRTTRHIHSNEKDQAGLAAFIRLPHYGDHATLGRMATDMAKRPTSWEKNINTALQQTTRAPRRAPLTILGDCGHQGNTKHKTINDAQGHAQVQPAPLRP